MGFSGNSTGDQNNFYFAFDFLFIRVAFNAFSNDASSKERNEASSEMLEGRENVLFHPREKKISCYRLVVVLSSSQSEAKSAS